MPPAPFRACPPRGVAALGAAFLWTLAPSMAAGQEAAVAFKVPPGSVATVVTAFAVQARVSVSAADVGGCGPSAGVVGRMRPTEALTRLLANTSCRYRALDARTFVVFRPRTPPPRRKPALSPASPKAMSPSAGQLSELVVTAGRRPVLLDRAPYSVSVVTGKDLAQTGVTDIGDVALMAAGLTTTDLGPGRDKLFLRGLSDGPLTGETQSTVGFYLDGARVTYNAPDPDLKLVDIDQIEILRGPQGALYGAGSIAGLVQVTTRRPDLSAWSAEADASGSATQSGAPGWSGDAVLNMPLVKDRLGVRLVGYDEVDGGYITDVGLGLSNVNRVAREGLRGEADWQVSPTWKVEATAVWQSINSADTHYADPAIGPLARRVYLQEPHNNNFAEASVRVQGVEPWGELDLTSSATSHQFDSRYDASLALPQFVPGAAIAPSPFDEADGTRAFVNELTASSPDSGRFRWLAGAFVSFSDDDLLSTLMTPVGGRAGAIAYSQNRNDSIVEGAVFGRVSYEVLPRVTVSAGGRWFRDAISTNATTAQPLAGLTSAFSGRLAFSGFAPQLIVRYSPTDAASVYAQASEGYRAGGFNTAGLVGQAFSATVAGAQPPRQFKGDELWNYETGLKLRLFDGRAQLRVAGFYMVWNSVQSDQLLPNGLPYTTNLGDGRDFGSEFEADVRPDDHWRVQANATLSEPDLTHPNPAFAAAPENGLPGAASFSGAVVVSYARRLPRGLTLRLMSAYGWVGASRLTLDATTSAVMGNYGYSRFGAQLEGGRWTTSLFLQAPLTGLGDTFAYGNPFSFRYFPQTTPQRPTTVTWTVSRRIP